MSAPGATVPDHHLFNERTPTTVDDQNSRRAAAAIAEALDDGVDVAEFLAHALCTVAAAEGGVEEVLRNRSGSWEAGHLRSLMEGTVGPDGEGLAAHRKDAEPETFEAELRPKQGGWRLDVRLPGLPGSGWPTTSFSDRGTTVPTVTERNAALEALGYRPADPDAEHVGWAWIEAQETADEAAYFIGVTRVLPLRADQHGPAAYFDQLAAFAEDPEHGDAARDLIRRHADAFPSSTATDTETSR
ncbi:DUF6303 family protein [Streptacidiphilus carbonis]|uniref:DUF6303 family protein n=1 Tax=Streptacidiphilus carbonis TaxID=105422 RepID=UPI0005A998C0|nr:DUF6303 family protein [Streptacidiphilus carbonis]